MGQLRALPIDQ